MTELELIRLMSGSFFTNFAAAMAQQVRDADAFPQLYAVATSQHEELPDGVRRKVLFRSAYVLDTLYFSAPELLAPYLASFCGRDFAACMDPSAKRHFAKIMLHLLQSYDPGLPAMEAIAEAAAQWAVDPKAKVAVRIGAVEVLKCCRARVDWVAESWDDLLGVVVRDATPGIRCRMRTSWKERP